MRTITLFRSLGPVDLKNVWRDSLLLWILLLPMVLALMLRVAVPVLTLLLSERYRFDLEPYYPLIICSFVIAAPTVAGMVVGFLLLDERDDRMMTALLVTPIPLASYLFYRLSVPVALGFVMTVLCYPIAGIAPLAPLDLLVVAALGSLTGPLLALYLVAFAENKVSGLALVKLVNGVMLIPIAAFFVSSPVQLAAGIVPTFWPMKVVWQAAEGSSYGWYAIGGVVIHLLVLSLLLRRFVAVVHR